MRQVGFHYTDKKRSVSPCGTQTFISSFMTARQFALLRSMSHIRHSASQHFAFLNTFIACPANLEIYLDQISIKILHKQIIKKRYYVVAEIWTSTLRITIETRLYRIP